MNPRWNQTASGYSTTTKRRTSPPFSINCAGFLQPRSLGDLSRTNASGAGPNVLRTSVDHGPDTLQIRLPAPLGDVVCVGDVAPGHRSFAADFTSLRHFSGPPRGPQEIGDALNSTNAASWQGRALPNARFCHLCVQKTVSDCEVSRDENAREIDGKQRNQFAFLVGSRIPIAIRFQKERNMRSSLFFFIHLFLTL